MRHQPLFTGNISFVAEDPVNWMCQDRANILAVAGAVPSPSTEPAALTILGQISFEDFWADATAGYRGPTRFTGAKASVKLTSPSNPRFQLVWKTAIKNIDKVSAVIAVPGQNHNGFAAKMNYKFSHRPFSVRSSLCLFPCSCSHRVCGQVKEKYDADESDMGMFLSILLMLVLIHYYFDLVEDTFKLENIPATSPTAAAELKAIKNTHIYNPLPAYHIDGTIILPKNYRAKLQGATVIMTFGLKHYFIGPRSEKVGGSNTYVADIIKIRVVEAALPRPVAVVKRKRVSTTDCDGLPALSKLARTA